MLEKLRELLNAKLEPEPTMWQKICKYFRRAEPNYPEYRHEFYVKRVGIVTAMVLSFVQFLMDNASHIVVLYFLIKFIIRLAKAFFTRPPIPRIPGQQPERQQPEGQQPEGQYPEGQHPERQQPEGQQAGEQQSEGQQPERQQPDGQQAGEQQPE
ncbi:GL26806 [Drosophila persimilis]|uniref:GL26806 n=1 Tax=Drosophila persimilis TaxID=7234 RepID=B4H2E0_DROPE|nr:GL26806 [Drosophila persimilis]